MTSTAGYGTNPELGLPVTSTVDPTGLALTTATDYEAPGAGYLRRIKRRLPAGVGSEIASAYYGAAEGPIGAVCGVTAGQKQYGALKQTTAADPDGAGAGQPLVRQYVYDSAGRQVGSRVGYGSGTGAVASAGWVCTAFDSRGRPATVTFPAFGAQTATRTVTYSYAVGSPASPLVTSVTDSAAPSASSKKVTTTTDLLGRVVSYTDVWNKTTSTSYDQTGRVTQATNPGGTVGYGYTTDGLVDTVSLNGGVLADPTYNGWGRMTGVSYPSGGTNKGNATSGSFTIDPVWFRPNGVTWSGPGGAIAANAHTSRLDGNVVDETIDGVDAYPGGELRVRQRGPSCWRSGVGTHGWGCGVAERLLRLPGDNRHVWGVAEWFGWGGGGAELEPGSQNHNTVRWGRGVGDLQLRLGGSSHLDDRSGVRHGRL